MGWEKLTNDKKLVLDASVYIKLIAEESDSDKALKLINEAEKKGISILVPDLFIIEVIDFLSREKHPDKNSRSLYSWLKESFDIFPITDALIQTAITITYDNKSGGYPRFYDSIYHALAIESGCELVTADKKHYSKTKHLGNILLLSALSMEQEKDSSMNKAGNKPILKSKSGIEKQQNEKYNKL